MKKIILFGGTFDPIHQGHLSIALAAKEQLQADNVIFILSKSPRWKRPTVSTNDRLNMLKLAIENIEGFTYSTFEIDNNSDFDYSIDTARHFVNSSKKKGEDVKYYWLIGSDQVAQLDRWAQIKLKNKERLAEYVKKSNNVILDPNSIFDVQVKRLHEYKRQLLNALQILHLYNRLKENPDLDITPRTFIFGAKAASSYYVAKLIIRLIYMIGEVVNNDKSIKGKIKVVFIENYRVSNAEWIFAAADVSEQISTASKEASGTGNMKFMLNGALTLGTMDGANIEIVEEAGKADKRNIGLFDEAIASEVADFRFWGTVGYAVLAREGKLEGQEATMKKISVKKIILSVIAVFLVGVITFFANARERNDQKRTP